MYNNWLKLGISGWKLVYKNHYFNVVDKNYIIWDTLALEMYNIVVENQDNVYENEAQFRS